jgi:hypothetical protein
MNAGLRSVGADSSSAINSKEDLKEKRDAMRDYGLQSLAANLTATQSEMVAVTSNSNLKKWCANFKDALENALLNASRHMRYADGPAVVLNSHFRHGFDINF